MRPLRCTFVSALVIASAVTAVPSPAAAGDSKAARLRRLLDSHPAAVERLAAQGANPSNVSFVSLETPAHRGYAWSTIAYKARPSARTRVAFTFHRSAVEDTQFQSSDFSWTLPRRALRMSRRLKPASLDTGKAMGRNGAIAMKLRGRSQYARLTPEGCTGWVEYRVGRLRGRLRVHLRDDFFGRVALRRVRVLLYREHDLRCPPPPTVPPCPDDLWLSARDPEAGVAIGVFRTEEGRVDQRVAVAGKSGKADAVHRISVQIGVPEAFQASDDLTSATVDGDAAGPWLSGDLSYLAPPPAAESVDEDCGPHRATSGVVTGDFTAHFDSIGPVTPAPTGLGATLRREGP